MNDKAAVHFSKPHVTATRYERLRLCRKCGAFTALPGDTCSSCGKKTAFMPVAKLGRNAEWIRLAVETSLLLLAVLSAVYLADSGKEKMITAACGAVLLLFSLGLYRFYHPILKMYRLSRAFEKNVAQIAKGLSSDENAAGLDYDAARYKECYEKLREIGHFKLDERIKVNKMVCLGHFVLRKDMDLELESVVPHAYSKLFNLHLWEVSKVNPALIREHTIDYVLRYRWKIDKQEYGPKLLTNVASAALYAKRNLPFCQDLIGDYAAFLPRDRFRRLCQMISGAQGRPYPELVQRVRQIANTHYAGDEEIQRLI
ncbi:hypothetical protein [Gorillibacterium massiliense]|uniref:hypothetical protein n=1 Tax=Gorillibacterium massiliense TaxID=1280390 RepID=UPI0004B4E4F6|nr:hypothetical protein [Gorillibacterium massiliense]